MSQKIAIVGGGYVGAELAKSLDDTVEVTLIEPRSHFVHAPAMIRAVVDPSLLDRALIPYDRLLTNGRVIASKAKAIDAKGVTLEDGTRVEADQIVVATGSGNAVPFKPQGSDIADLKADNQRIHQQLKAAQSIGIVGAGAVGTELAGEIAHAMPDKQVTLISSDDSLFPTMPSKLGRSLAAKLRKAGVTLILGQMAENLKSLTKPYTGPLQLADGSQHDFDLIFPVIGSRANSELLEALAGVEKSTANRIKVDPWMRPSALPNVFAAGDVVDAGDAMTIVAISRQLPWLKATLTGVVEGKTVEDMKPYKPWGSKALILVPLGPKQGNSFLGFFTAGDFLTSKMKGADLFLQKYAKLLNQSES
ncbi:NAD(P)/FAD-dependent oxidoreductase [Sulfitobacter donghicola]|uniref:N-acyl homoserine lactone synthase n=1 Tax=Sulfitobacter donghicola DSW-25 = KCTC 12864 = JCM 14565 TaxID=1300350 RepID=A0A073ISD9_9RHOB|nr:FAD-dependent oxidoreductase [Sulfitobacter donghicola]KEJ88312.1 N-acyl homoserine lactone synthase [Sulfitobacter donghicola DSW-25 = KCTC 12864 = JCM 14565]KIN68908.1 NAD(FAD)-dependent dehydrogenase [Sulfitobacter donghicola DSW-25 = KCTC 12864 = JCM 14565]